MTISAHLFFLRINIKCFIHSRPHNFCGWQFSHFSFLKLSTLEPKSLYNSLLLVHCRLHDWISSCNRHICEWIWRSVKERAVVLNWYWTLAAFTLRLKVCLLEILIERIMKHVRKTLGRSFIELILMGLNSFWCLKIVRQESGFLEVFYGISVRTWMASYRRAIRKGQFVLFN